MTHSRWKAALCAPGRAAGPVRQIFRTATVSQDRPEGVLEAINGL